jgi:hypothetical protein
VLRRLSGPDKDEMAELKNAENSAIGGLIGRVGIEKYIGNF